MLVYICYLILLKMAVLGLTFVKDEKRDTFFSFLSFLTSVGSD